MSLTNHQLDSRESQLILPEQIIKDDTSIFSEKFNRLPFMFSHNLANHPLFEIPCLVELAATLSATVRKPHCQSSEVNFNQKAFSRGNITQAQMLERLANIEESASWLLLYNIQAVPEYRALLEKIIAELEDVTDLPLHKEISWQDAYIFVASPHAITPYHFDHESTFLFQIHGEREANLFSNDPSIVSEQELERYYFGDLNAGTYSQEKQHKANIYPLVPGKGVHLPIRGPHYFKNGDKYSVVLGIHMFMRSYDLQAPIYQVNFILRQLGLKPKPPGKSVLSDKLKIWVMGLISKRNPKNKYDLIWSGAARITNLIKSVIKILEWLKLQ